MDRPASAARRRKSQVFVEIPPSPFTAKSGKADRAGPPESTPLKAVAINVDNAPSPASTTSQLKRKSPEDAHTTTKQKDDAQAPRLKKSKTENAEAATSAKKPSNTGKADTDSRDAAKVVEGPVRCHQCSRQMLPEGERDAHEWLGRASLSARIQTWLSAASSGQMGSAAVSSIASLAYATDTNRISPPYTLPSLRAPRLRTGRNMRTVSTISSGE